MTDANGKFALRGLSEGLTMVYARALDIKQTVNCRLPSTAIKTTSKSG